MEVVIAEIKHSQEHGLTRSALDNTGAYVKKKLVAHPASVAQHPEATVGEFKAQPDVYQPSTFRRHGNIVCAV